MNIVVGDENLLASGPADSPDGKIFAANRAVGRVALAVAAVAGESRRARVHEAGSLRVRFPNGTSRAALDAVIVNTAGGMTGGYCFDIDMSVGAGARLSDCYVGPYTAIGEGCTISGAEIEHSILLEGCTISGLDGRMESSLLGRGVTIRRGERQPRAYRFMVGDSSDISIL